ncbi:ATP-binding cassette, subfamily B [Paenibacillus sophorae]|uniref:ABC transporter ATP-binding protein/permease n=1 Tax=Paenibacillus sophorae TaxID=1333845 RepID=A0A1H8N8E9_9BACL|nr:ABC transporter ATP-binding protein [Paenibacillus sophorae]QWU14737.1 ABC transporter ATP-binding protein/permease [Paenibacillus sophorae]SEO25870.1 ATP-binding cassette, subfamily B [Paenibacillus sophorae]
MFKALLEPFRHPRPVIELGESRGLSSGRKPKAAGAKDWSSTLRRLWSYLAERRIKLILVLVMVVFSSGLSLLGPFMIGRAVDRYLEGGGSHWGLFLTGLGAVYVLYSLTSWLQNIWMIEISQETVYRMRTELFSHLHSLPISFFNRRQQGEIMSRLTNDIENVSSNLNSSAIDIFSGVLTLAGTLTVMLWLSPLLTLLTFIVVPIMALGMRWITRRTGPLFKQRQRNMGELNGYIEETLSGQRVIKAFGQEHRVISGFQDRNNRIMLSGFWAQSISGFIPKLMNGLNDLSFAIVAGFGGILAVRGSITVGVILVFVEYTRQFTRPLNDLANQWNSVLSAIAGAERVFEVLDERAEAEDESDAAAVEHIRGEVRFREVSFSYNGESDNLKDISFEAKPGEMIALVGPTGAGKTTLIGLLSRFYNPSKGIITIDGRDLASIRRESLRSQMAFVLQDTFLFKGSIRDNIRYGRLDASDEEVERAARLANAHSFIMRLPGGYDRMLSVEGGGISQGQKQLLAIARAILADPAMLVLDEATSSIDTVTELKIQEGLQSLMKGRTSFVIAHRLNTIRQADRILVLQDGRLVQQGSHEELLDKGGLYSELVKGAVKV